MTTSMNVGTGEWKMAVKNREYKTGEGKAGLKNIPFQKRLEHRGRKSRIKKHSFPKTSGATSG